MFQIFSRHPQRDASERHSRQESTASVVPNPRSDAAAEASRLLGLFGVKRDMLRVRVKTQPFALEPGQTVTVTYPHHGLSSGRDFVVVGMVEDSAINEVTLDLWG